MKKCFHRVDPARKEITTVFDGKKKPIIKLMEGDSADLMTPPAEVAIAVFSPEPDSEWLLDTGTLDMALAWSLAGVEVILEVGFESRGRIPLDQLLAICGGSGFSVALALPKTRDMESIDEWIRWNRDAAMAMVVAPQPCYLYPASQYIEWLMLNEIEPQDIRVVTLPNHPYGRWVAKSLIKPKLYKLLKLNIDEELYLLLGNGWEKDINHRIAEAVFLQPASTV